MTVLDGFDEIWEGRNRFTFDRAPRPAACAHAAAFERWCQQLRAQLGEQPSPLAVARAKLALQDKWHDFRSLAPAAHRDRVSKRGHRCLYAVYLECYRAVRELELSLAPPPLEPPPSDPPTRPAPPGIHLGELAGAGGA